MTKRITLTLVCIYWSRGNSLLISAHTSSDTHRVHLTQGHREQLIPTGKRRKIQIIFSNLNLLSFSSATSHSITSCLGQGKIRRYLFVILIIVQTRKHKQPSHPYILFGLLQTKENCVLFCFFSLLFRTFGVLIILLFIQKKNK